LFLFFSQFFSFFSFMKCRITTQRQYIYIITVHYNDNLLRVYCLHSKINVHSKIHCVSTTILQRYYFLFPLFNSSGLWVCIHMRCLFTDVHVILFTDRTSFIPVCETLLAVYFTHQSPVVRVADWCSKLMETTFSLKIFKLF